MKYKLHTLVGALTFKAGSFGTHFAPYRFEIFPKFGICPRKCLKIVWSRCSDGIVSKKQSRPLKLCKNTEKGFDIFLAFFFFGIRPSNLQNKTSKLRQNRWKISQIEWQFKSARAHVSVAMVTSRYSSQNAIVLHGLLLLIVCYFLCSFVIFLHPAMHFKGKRRKNTFGNTIDTPGYGTNFHVIVSELSKKPNS